MTSREIRALPEGAYVLARLSGDRETVRLLGIREPTSEERGFGYSSNFVDVRRFLLGGYVDTWVYPRDVLAPTDPEPGTLAIIEYVEREVGEKSRSPL